MRIAGLEFEGKVSLTSVLAVVMAFVAMVGGWYKFDARVAAAENSIHYLQDARQKDEAAREQLRQALFDLNVTVGKLEQRLEDEDRSKHGN